MISRARVRRAFRRESIGVDVRAALDLVGTLVAYLSLAFTLPTAVALLYGETFWPFVLSGLLTAGLGLALRAIGRGGDEVRPREGFLVVTLTWALAAAVGALPYVLSGHPELGRPLDAYFEAMSGFTTTGASVVTDLTTLSQSMALWRQFTQWVGGMGIIVLFLAVLPRLRVGGRQLLQHELPGPEVAPLATTIRDTARRLWLLYVGLTVAEVAILTALGWSGVDERLNLFEAVAHAFSTLPTGGFSTQPDSIGAFAPVTQWVIVAFMAMAGLNFALLYRAFVRREPRPALRDSELRLYAVLLVAAVTFVSAELAVEGIYAGEEALRHGAFQAVSIMTTTGYATADFAQWTIFATVLLVGLMFVGGSAGSTAGSVKVVRHLLVGKILQRELDQTVHPEVVRPIRLNRRIVEERTLRAVLAFVLLYVGLFAVGALALLLDAARTGLPLTAFEAVAATATTLGNVGPALGFAGPFGSFAGFSDVSTGVMIALMLCGRLEIIPVAVLFTKRYWRA